MGLVKPTGPKHQHDCLQLAIFKALDSDGNNVLDLGDIREAIGAEAPENGAEPMPENKDQ